MKIFNVRLGHATNSSSAHSIIICSSKQIPSDVQLEDYQFGWQNFVASSIKAKKVYISILLYQALRSVLKDERVVYAIVKEWAGLKESFEKFPARDGHIDHQSIMDLPYNWEGTAVDYDFFNEFKNFICRDDVIIIGGNDNDGGDDPPLESKVCNLGLPSDSFRSKHLVCRKDNNYWTIFNRNTGLKIRMSFDTAGEIEASKSAAPELIDIKITDKCDHNCAYCYQASNKNGYHSSKETMIYIADACAIMKVFEVALGGGDPISHPDIIDIIKEFKTKKIIANLSTKSTAWLSNDSFRNAIFENCGTVAFSVSTLKETQDIITELKKYSLTDHQWGERRKTSLHYVMGSSDIDELSRILSLCYDEEMSIVLLGYKINGRGKVFIPHDYSTWIKMINKLRESGKYPTIAIDTKLAKDYKSQLKLLANDILVHPEDGKFSMYIDAVNGFAGPSSYCDGNEMDYIMLAPNHDYTKASTLSDTLLSLFKKY